MLDLGAVAPAPAGDGGLGSLTEVNERSARGEAGAGLAARVVGLQNSGGAPVRVLRVLLLRGEGPFAVEALAVERAGLVGAGAGAGVGDGDGAEGARGADGTGGALPAELAPGAFLPLRVSFAAPALAGDFDDWLLALVEDAPGTVWNPSYLVISCDIL